MIKELLLLPLLDVLLYSLPSLQLLLIQEDRLATNGYKYTMVEMPLRQPR
jgi:hypothetical protein